MDEDFSGFESDLRRQGMRWIAGVDEVGRGPLAGPVVAAACLIPPQVQLHGIRDSKALSPSARAKLYWNIIRESLIGIGVVSEREIDRTNIHRASLAAMRQAVLQLPITPDIVLIDGAFKTDLPIDQIPVVRGDQKLISIGAASIVAKVTRDAMMDEIDLRFPEYGFRRHKGYPTSEHLAALKNAGPSPIHRMSFRPVAEVALGRLA